MTREEIRQKAIKRVSNITETCRETPCKHCTKFEECKQIQQTQCPYPREIWSYEHGFADGFEEGRKQAIKHGHWIEMDFKRNDSDLVFLKCSNCFDVDVLYARHMKYCPNCGAKMDGEGEEA